MFLISELQRERSKVIKVTYVGFFSFDFFFVVILQAAVAVAVGCGRCQILKSPKTSTALPKP